MPPKKQAVKHNTYGKRFTNGHKQFTSAECAGMIEQQARENITAAIFQREKMILVKPRNPINGELTSRENAEYLVPLSVMADQKTVQLPARVKSQEELNSAHEKLRGTTMFS